MLNERTYSDILAKIESYEDLDSLSASELAKITYTSPSTISRFVKKSGFRNFNEMKLKLLHERESSFYLSESFHEWCTMINVSLNDLEPEVLSIVKDNKNKKILVYSERMYLLIARQFLESLSLLEIDCVMVTKQYLASITTPDDYICISIGGLPKDLYYPDLQYYEIDFKRSLKSIQLSNVMCIGLATPRRLEFNTTAHSFQIACINLLLCMLVDAVDLN